MIPESNDKKPSWDFVYELLIRHFGSLEKARCSQDGRAVISIYLTGRGPDNP